MNRRHGVMTPAQKLNVPARVLNVQSRKNTSGATKIRLDRLLRAKEPQILIKRLLGGIGDVLMTTPLLKAIKKLIPNCKLVYATDLEYSWGALAEIIKHNPYVDELIASSNINESRYDYSVDITATGLSEEKSGTVPPNRIDMFADEVGVSVEEDPVPVYETTIEERNWAKQYIEDKYLLGAKREEVNLILVQAKSNDARRTWPLEYVQELCNKLAEKPNNRVLLYVWSDDVAKHFKSESERLFIVKDEKMPRQAAVMEQSDLVVCPDSAFLHLAGALQKKTVAIFGPIPPESRINHYPNTTAVEIQLHCKYCVVGESNVLTSDGYKQIKDIKENDQVLTSSGELKRVLKLHKNKREDRTLLEIETFGSYKPIILTEEHKILKTQRYYKKINKKEVPLFKELEWTEAKDIKKGDYCCLPIPKTKESINPLLKSKDLAWLVGLFVAEGWTSVPVKTARSYITYFSISNKEKDIEEKVKKIVLENKHIFNSTHHNKGFFSVKPNSKGESNVIQINNKNFVSLLSDLFKIPGKINLSNKYIPSELLFSSEEIVESFLKGFLKGDGYVDNKDFVVSSAKEDIAFGTQALFLKLGRLSKVYKRVRDTNYKKDSTIYRVYISKKTEYKRWYKNDNYYLVPVKNVVESNRQDKYVYDITVEDDPTFTINNIAIYDCWYSPSACMQQHTEKLACLTKLKPDMVLKAIIEKLDEPYKASAFITHGDELTTKGQDPIVLVKRATRGLGDIMMATTGIEALKKKYPNKKLHVSVDPSVSKVLENNPYIDEVLDIHEPINYKRYHTIIDISSPCARYESMRVRSGRPVEKSRVEIFAEAMGTRSLIPDILPRYYFSEDELKWSKKFLKDNHINKNKRTIALSLKSAEEYRDWPEEKIIELCNYLKPKYNIVMTGVEKRLHIPGIIDACSLPLRDSFSIIGSCDGLVTVDTSTLHIAAANKIPTVALFGPIDWKARCKGYKNTTVVVSNLPCIPCWRNGTGKCKQTGLVKGISKCMESISPKHIAKIVKQKL